VRGRLAEAFRLEYGRVVDHWPASGAPERPGAWPGPAAGLTALEAIKSPALRAYHLLPAARADFLCRLRRWAEAAEAYRQAITLTDNAR
jgi:predicted RNA polymerase sigma factor